MAAIQHPKREAEKAHLEATHAAFDDLQAIIDDQIAQNDQVVVRWTATGRYAREATGSTPSRQRTTFHGVARLRTVDGKIVNFEGFSDLAEAFADSEGRPLPCTPSDFRHV